MVRISVKCSFGNTVIAYQLQDGLQQAGLINLGQLLLKVVIKHLPILPNNSIHAVNVVTSVLRCRF